MFLLFIIVSLAFAEDTDDEVFLYAPTIRRAYHCLSDYICVEFDKPIGVFGNGGWFIQSEFCDMTEASLFHRYLENILLLDYNYKYCGKATVLATERGSSDIYDKEGQKLSLRAGYYEMVDVLIWK